MERRDALKAIAAGIAGLAGASATPAPTAASLGLPETIMGFPVVVDDCLPSGPVVLKMRKLTGMMRVSPELLEDNVIGDPLSAIQEYERMSLEQFIAKAEGRPDPYPEFTKHIESLPPSDWCDSDEEYDSDNDWEG